MILNRNGLSLPINSISNNELIKIKDNLTVKPAVHPDYNTKVEAYPLYKEITNNIVIPRYYAKNTMKMNIPEISERVVLTNINFLGQLRDKQPEIANVCLNTIRETGGGIISLHCGAGKCLAKDTPVLMFDNSIKLVQHIRKGEQLMGPDGNPRNVLSLSFGYDDMYSIIPIYDGNQLIDCKYTVNKDHILSLKDEFGIPFDINVVEYLKYNYVGWGYRMQLDKTQKSEDKYQKYVKNYGKIKDNLIKLNYMQVVLNSKFNIEKLKQFILSLGYFIVKTTISYFYVTLDKYLTYNFSVEYKGKDWYYGFTIDGDRRFLLGDYTVTHNTVIALWLSAQLNKKTLIVVHKTFLMDQWIERISQYTNAKVGIIQRKQIDVKDKDIVIAMIQSISMIDYDNSIFNDFGLVIYDECHHAASKVYSRALQKIGTQYTIGLSATPFRLDGLTKVLYWYIGPIIYRLVRKGENRVYVKNINYTCSHPLFVDIFKKKHGKNKPVHQKMITNMYKIDVRNNFIISIINFVRNLPNRKLLILSGRLEHLRILKTGVDNIIKLEESKQTTSYYVGVMKQEKLIEAAEANIIFATFNMAEEGLDIADLNTLILATSKKNVEQAAGRIIRKAIQDGDICPMIIDIKDQLSGFMGWGDKRDKFFTQQNHTIHNAIAKENDFIEPKRYLLDNKWLEESYENEITNELMRKLYIKNTHGVEYYKLLKEIDFKDEPLDKYAFKHKIEEIFETPYERIYRENNQIENDDNPDNVAPIIDEEDDIIFNANRRRLM